MLSGVTCFSLRGRGCFLERLEKNITMLLCFYLNIILDTDILKQLPKRANGFSNIWLALQRGVAGERPSVLFAEDVRLFGRGWELSDLLLLATACARAESCVCVLRRGLGAEDPSGCAGRGRGRLP